MSAGRPTRWRCTCRCAFWPRSPPSPSGPTPARSTCSKITWGTTIGLAVAHWFAFRVSARLVAAGELGRHEVHTAAAQLVGALAVALLVTVPVVLLPATAELDVVRLVLAGFVAAIGYAVARNSGASMRRSAIYAASILVIALAIAVLKNVLSGH
jgi:hypothetical protein